MTATRKSNRNNVVPENAWSHPAYPLMALAQHAQKEQRQRKRTLADTRRNAAALKRVARKRAGEKARHRRVCDASYEEKAYTEEGSDAVRRASSFTLHFQRHSVRQTLKSRAQSPSQAEDAALDSGR